MNKSYEHIEVVLPLELSDPGDVRETLFQSFHNELMDTVRLYGLTEVMQDNRNLNDMSCEEHSSPCDDGWSVIVQKGNTYYA